jgi:hypothetical protein
MSWNIGDTTKYANRATVWKIEKKEKYALVTLGTSRKDVRSETGYSNSNWFSRFVGDAFGKIDEVEKGTRIEILNGFLAQEPYMKDGVKTYPKAPQATIFDFKVISKPSNDGGLDKPPQVEDDEIPWD